MEDKCARRVAFEGGGCEILELESLLNGRMGGSKKGVDLRKCP